MKTSKTFARNLQELARIKGVFVSVALANPAASFRLVSDDVEVYHLLVVPVLSQRLLVPQVVRLPPSESALVADSVDGLSECGFDVEPFGTDTFKVDAVPVFLDPGLVGVAVIRIAESLRDGMSASPGTEWRRETIAQSVANVHSGKTVALDAAHSRKIVDDLSRCRQPYCTPSGKPTMVWTSFPELERKLGL